MLALQVTARYRNFFGEVLCYSISVLDDAEEEVNMDDVQPKEICMHFPPGSRVNIKWKRPVQVSIALHHATCSASPHWGKQGFFSFLCENACQIYLVRLAFSSTLTASLIAKAAWLGSETPAENQQALGSHVLELLGAGGWCLTLLCLC